MTTDLFSDLNTRHNRFLSKLENRELDGFLTSKPENLKYLFNIECSVGFALTFKGTSTLIVDSRYINQAQNQALYCEVELASNGLKKAIKTQLNEKKGSLGFESTHLPYGTASGLKQSAPNLDLIGQEQLIEELRQIKSQAELERLRYAFRTALSVHDSVFSDISLWGKSESEIAARLDFEMRLAGSECPAFETMVLSGTRSANPHSRPSGNRIDNDSPLLVDFGAVIEGYRSDNTRIHLPPGFGRPEILDIVQEAQSRTIDAIKPGIPASDLDEIARQLITGKGFGNNFGHGLGHGLGLEVHELPRINAFSNALLEEGMVFTVEPGIYIPGLFGVRLEEAIVVTAEGCDVLPG
jgi:Xaa-Pro aminopeptidase